MAFHPTNSSLLLIAVTNSTQSGYSLQHYAQAQVVELRFAPAGSAVFGVQFSPANGITAIGLANSTVYSLLVPAAPGSWISSRGSCAVEPEHTGQVTFDREGAFALVYGRNIVSLITVATNGSILRRARYANSSLGSLASAVFVDEYTFLAVRTGAPSVSAFAVDAVSYRIRLTWEQTVAASAIRQIFREPLNGRFGLLCAQPARIAFYSLDNEQQNALYAGNVSALSALVPGSADSIALVSLSADYQHVLLANDTQVHFLLGAGITRKKGYAYIYI